VQAAADAGLLSSLDAVPHSSTDEEITAVIDAAVLDHQGGCAGRLP
jgi:hypothetical protein